MFALFLQSFYKIYDSLLRFEDIYTREEINGHWYRTRYTFDNFLNVLNTTFSKIDIFPSDSEHRRILLCER